MAFTLELGSATTTVDFLGNTAPTGLSNSYCLLADGGFNVGQPSVKDVYSPSHFGDVPVSREYGNRQVSIQFAIKADTRANIGRVIALIQQLLTDAWNYHAKRTVGQLVQIKHRWDNYTQYSYFPVVSGVFMLPGNTWSVEQVLQQDGDGNFIIKDCKIVFQCLPRIFEYSWVNKTVAGQGTGTFGNAWDGTYVEHFAHSGAVFDGDLDMPLQIKLTNTHATYVPTKIIIGAGLWNSARDANDYVWEGEDAIAYVGSGTGSTSTGSDSTMSGGSYRSLTYDPAAANDWSPYLDWYILTGRELPQGVFRVFARFRSAVPTSTQARLDLKYTNFNKTITGDIVYPLTASTYILDMGTFYNPPKLNPYILRYANLGGGRGGIVQPRMYFNSIDGNQDTIQLDCIHFVHQDLGYRILELPTTGVANGDHLYDDAIYDASWVEFNTSTKVGEVVTPLFNPIYLPPNEPAIVQVLYVESGGKMIRGHTMNYAISTNNSWLHQSTYEA